MADDLPPGFAVVSPGAADDLPPGFAVVKPAVPEQSSTLGDMAKSLGSGVVRGSVELGMLPVTMKRLGDQGTEYLFNKGDALVRSIFGLDPMDEATRARIAEARAGSPAEKIDSAIYSGQDAARGVMNDYLHKPETTAGKYAETVGEFMAPGGLPSKAARTAPTLARKGLEYALDLGRNAVVPAVTSETAGQLTEGTSYEPVARLIGAIMGNTATGLASAANAPESALRRAVGPADQIDWSRALNLQNNSTGIRLTGPEAITQAQNGASALPNVLRLVEGNVEGRAATAPFFAARPAQVDTAVGNLLDAVGPQSPNPSVLGPRASEAATNAIRDVEQTRTAAVQPTYRAANTDLVPEAGINGLIGQIDALTAADQTGVLAGPLNDLRNRLIATPAQPGSPATRTPVLGPNGQVVRYTQTPAVAPTPAIPITDVENLDRTRKYFRDRMDLPQIGQDAITKEQNATVTGILQQLDQLMENNSANFAAGKQQYADLSRNVVQPIAEGPLGKVAAANETATAGNAILPQNPLTGSQGETADAVQRLVQQDPETLVGLVRQNMADRYGKAATETQEANREFAGAKFHRDMAGNQQKRDTLEAVLANLPTRDAANAAPELLDVLQATGRRKPIGSATDFNASLRGDLGVASPAGRAISFIKSLGTSFAANAGDAANRLAFRRSISSLADMFTDPNSVELIRDALNRNVGSGLGEAAARSIAQTPAATRERK
jgi:hypothetical protein